MLNETLRLVRVFHDLNKTELASRVGLSKSYVTELESGEKRVTLEVLQKYANAFSIPVSSLMMFAERTSDNDLYDHARASVTEKVTKMLEWIEMITREEAENGDNE